jgi:hypothetical protein
MRIYVEDPKIYKYFTFSFYLPFYSYEEVFISVGFNCFTDKCIGAAFV